MRIIKSSSCTASEVGYRCPLYRDRYISRCGELLERLMSASFRPGQSRLDNAPLPIDPRPNNDDPATREQAWWSTERKVHAGFAFALACLAVVGTVSFVSVLHLNRDSAQVAHTYEVMNRLDALVTSVTNAQIGGRRYVTLGGDEYLDRYRQAAQAVHETVQQIQGLTADNPVQQKRLATAEVLGNFQLLADLAAGIELRQSQGPRRPNRPM